MQVNRCLLKTLFQRALSGFLHLSTQDEFQFDPLLLCIYFASLSCLIYCLFFKQAARSTGTKSTASHTAVASTDRAGRLLSL